MKSPTIVAAASAPGQGAVAVLRLSGPEVLEILAKGIRLDPKTIRLAPRRLRLARFYDAAGEVLDQVLVAYMPSPKSFTGEDMVEVHGHGGRAAVEALLARLLELGAEPAGAGEFTRRALENGKLDLSQAEAVARMIEAGSRAELAGAVRVLEGELSQKLGSLQLAIEILLAEIEASLNFPEEPDLESLDLRSRRLEPLLAKAEALEQGLRRRVDSGAAEVVLAGPPNVGKSSIINKLSGKQVALVTSQAGTTRDAVSVELELGGRRLRLVDTAGRSKELPAGEADRAAEVLALARAEQADLVLWVDDAWLASEDLAKQTWGETLLPLRNKADLLDETRAENLDAELRARGGLLVSALDGRGLDDLSDLLVRRLDDLLGPADGLPLTTRQAVAMDKLMAALRRAEKTLDHQVELAAEDLRQAMDAMGELTGRKLEPDLLDRIFSSFCIGK